METLRHLIREALSSVGEKPYRTENIDVSMYDKSLPDGDYISESKAVITWQVDTDEREWGIKTIEPSILSLHVNIEVWRESIEDYESFERAYIVNRELAKGFNLEITKTTDKGQIVPMDVTIDSDQKSIEVDFYYP